MIAGLKVFRLVPPDVADVLDLNPGLVLAHRIEDPIRAGQELPERRGFPPLPVLGPEVRVS